MRIVDQLTREPKSLPLVLLTASVRHGILRIHTGASPSAGKGQHNAHREGSVTQDHRPPAGARERSRPHPNEPREDTSGAARPGCPQPGREGTGAAWRTPAAALRGQSESPQRRGQGGRPGPAGAHFPPLTSPPPSAGRCAALPHGGGRPVALRGGLRRRGGPGRPPPPHGPLGSRAPQGAMSPGGAARPGPPHPPARLTGISAARM